MPAAPPSALVDAILEAFQEAGASCAFVSALRRHPRRFIVEADDRSIEVWIYAWTLTHGGRPSLPDEYRIQMTGVSSPLAANPDGYTLLLGYEPDLNMFAGFDLRRHCKFTTGSPSVQIDIQCLHRALQDGLAFDRKSNGEIAIGVRPDQIINYMANAEELHRLGRNTATYDLLVKASALKSIATKDLEVIPPKRRRILQSVKRWARRANFRKQVLCAYDYRCAVTRMQLRLVEAAHILPVQAEEAMDDIRNGVALSPTYHRAFDTGLIYLDDDYVMKLNVQKEIQLKTLKLDGGIVEFKRFLGKRIHLPADRRQWPAIKMIRKANEYRRIVR